MERQPIDDLFSRKLQDAEVRPSSDAWARLQGRQGVSHTTPLWRYVAVAASLLLVSSFGWWAIQSGHSKKVTVASAGKRDVSAHSEQIAGAEQTGGKQIQVEENAVNHSVGSRTNKRMERLAFAVSKDGSAEQKARKVVRELVKTIQKPIVVTAVVKQNKLSDPVEYANSSTVLVNEASAEIHSLVAERILVVSIAANPVVQAVGVVEAPVVGKQNNKGGGLGGFIRKVKRLKEGEAFVLNTETNNKMDRHSLTKVLDEVKESIRNNASDR